MGTPSGGSEGSPGALGGKLTSGWASPTILGLLIFGLVTALLGLFCLPGPYYKGFAISGPGLMMPAPGIAYVAYGAAGLLLLVGVGLLIQGRLFWGSAFLGYAAFWGPLGYMLIHGGFASGYGMAGFLFLWMMFTLTFLISSIKHGWSTFIPYLFLFIGFILLIIWSWQQGAGTTVATSEHWAIGAWLIITGLIWWYGGTAQLANHAWGKKVLPV